jgi:cysteine desulfurase
MLSTKLTSAITAYNTYKGVESVAELVSVTSTSFVVKFSGHFCFTCGVKHYFEDFMQDLEQEGIRAEIVMEKKIREDSYELVFLIKKRIYLDYAAATPLHEDVFLAMKPYFMTNYGNPGGTGEYAKQAYAAVMESRIKIADILGVKPTELIFTGSGTESINLGLQGVMHASKKKHIIISAIEHHAVTETCKALEKEGCRLTIIPVTKEGIIDLAQLQNAISKDTALISVMYANNEIGTIQPLKKIVRIAHDNNILVHTDACQAAGLLPLQNLGVDLMTLNASKMYGPKGIGLLYVRKGITIKPLVYGGGQEFGKRSGTEHVSGIVGMATALDIVEEEREQEVKRLTYLKDKLITGLLKIPHTQLNGSLQRLANNVHVSFKNIEAETLLDILHEHDIDASAGSACTSTQLQQSHVITALGLSYAWAHGSVRFTLGRGTTDEDIDFVITTITKAITELR